MKVQTAPVQPFSERSVSKLHVFNGHKSPRNPSPQNQSYINVREDAFSHFLVAVPIKFKNAGTAIKCLLDHWIIAFGPPIYLVTGRGSKYINDDMAHLRILICIHHSHRPILFHLGQTDSMEFKTKLWFTSADVPANNSKRLGSTSPYVCKCSQFTTSFCMESLSSYEIVVNTRSRIPLTFDLKPNRNATKPVFPYTVLNSRKIHINTKQT